MDSFMRGQDRTRGSLVSGVDLAARHHLRAMRAIVNEALARLDAPFDALNQDGGWPSIPPEQLLCATMFEKGPFNRACAAPPHL